MGKTMNIQHIGMRKQLHELNDALGLMDSPSDPEQSQRIRMQQAKNAGGSTDFAVLDLKLSKQGEKRVKKSQKDLSSIKEFCESTKFVENKSLTGAKIAMCIRVNGENATLALTYKAMGAKVRWCAPDLNGGDVLIIG